MRETRELETRFKILINCLRSLTASYYNSRDYGNPDEHTLKGQARCRRESSCCDMFQGRSEVGNG